jgi:ABC-type sugar transport system permease subunit
MKSEARLGWTLALPALTTIAAIALFPIAWTFWESLHLHDLRMPWLGRPFVGAANYLEALSDRRLAGALGHTAMFLGITVVLELALGLALALALDRAFRGREVVRTAILLPWAVPTVVGALVWRFIFESPSGLASAVVTMAGLTPPTWFADSIAAWVPLILADTWKSTPFVTLLLLAGLQEIDRSLYEAADVDGAGPWQRFIGITLPLVRPALLVAFVFRTLDAFRVFDLIYVMTGGGPGTATEPVSLYAFGVTLQNLRFGYGAALSIIVFAMAFVFALSTIHIVGGRAFEDRRA